MTHQVSKRGCEGSGGRFLIEWFEVLEDPVIMIPAIITAFFTLVGAFLGVYLSSKSAFKLARYNRQDSIRRELHDFKIIVETLELAIPFIQSHEKMDTLTKAKLSTMIGKVKKEGYIEKLEKVKKPTIIGAIEIDNLKNSINFLEYCLKEKKDDEIIYDSYQRYKGEIRRLEISLDVTYRY